MKITPFESVLALLMVAVMGDAVFVENHDFQTDIRSSEMNVDHGQTRATIMDTAIPGEYIVTLNNNTMLRSGLDLKGTIRGLLQQTGNSGLVLKTFTNVFKGFAIKGVFGVGLLNLRKNNMVKSVTPNVMVFATVDQISPVWNLDRIDQVSYPLNKTFSYKSNGTNVRAYILDTGILANHSEFLNSNGITRVQCGYSAYPGTSCIDPHGHGTHVAGTVGGRVYGVAKNVNLIAVRVIGASGIGDSAGMIAGIDYVVGEKKRLPTTPMVINMSFGLVYYKLMNDAVDKAVAAGIFVVVAAGNEAVDACTKSPASAASAVTVGATEQNIGINKTFDFVRNSTNFGPCVDIFSPGSSVISASNNCTTCNTSKSGTSMASPHVAGVAAQYLQVFPNATPAQVFVAIKLMSVPNQVSRNISYFPNTTKLFLRTTL